MSDLLKSLELRQSEPPKNRVFYRCEKPEHPMFALNEDGVIVTGLTLVHHYTVEYDFVHEEIQAVGAEARIIIPDDLEEGVVYEAILINIGRDWESGHIDSCDIAFSRVTDAKELSEIEAMREEQCMYDEAYGEAINSTSPLSP